MTTRLQQQRSDKHTASHLFMKMFMLLALMVGSVSSAWAQNVNNDSWDASTGIYAGFGNQRERYYDQGSIGAGDVMTQTQYGLNNGFYKVVMQLAASYTSGRGFVCPTGSGLSYAFANDDEVSLTVVERYAITESDMEYVTLYAYVTDGTLKYGIKNKADSGNWYVARVVSIEQPATKKAEFIATPSDGGKIVVSRNYGEYTKIAETADNGKLTLYLPTNVNFKAEAIANTNFTLSSFSNIGTNTVKTFSLSTSSAKYEAYFGEKVDEKFHFANTSMSIALTAQENSVTNTVLEDFVNDYETSFNISDLKNSEKFTWASSNEGVARYDGTKLRLVDIGTTVITITHKSTGIKAKLRLTVTASTAHHTVTTNGMTTKCEVTSEGKLEDERTLYSVPNILFRHGIWGFEDANNNANSAYGKQVHSASIVRKYEFNDNSGSVFASSTIDNTGVANTYVPNRPEAGTFYTFDPEVSGKLVVHGYTVNGAQGVWPVLYDWKDNGNGGLTDNGTLSAASNSVGVIDKEIKNDSQIKITEITSTFQLEKGHTYYLMGGFKSGNARVFLLNYFEYTPQRPKFATKAVRWDQVAQGGSYTQSATGVDGNVTYSAHVIDNSKVAAVDKSTRSADSDLTDSKVHIDGNGRVTIDSDVQDGGAILVTATVGNESDYYIITVPYNFTRNGNAGHIWNFYNTINWKRHLVDDTYYDRNTWESSLNSVKMKSDWYTQHKVREDTDKDGHIDYINVPVVATSAAVNGENAFYIPNTAGLIFNTNNVRGRFGSLVKGWRQDDSSCSFSYYNAFGDDLKAKLEIPYTEVDETDGVAICDGTSFTIPRVPKDWFIKVYWSEHSAHNGSCFQATNVKDLSGRLIDPNHCFIITGYDVLDAASGMPDGVVVFKATGDNDFNDVTFTLNDPDKGYSWNDIYRIEVCPKYSTDLHLRLDQYGNNTWGDLVNVDNENSGHVTVRRYYNVAGTNNTMRNYDEIKNFYYQGLVDYDNFIKSSSELGDLASKQNTTFTSPVTKIYSGVVGPCRCERGLSPLFTIEDVDGANVIGGKIDYYYQNDGKINVSLNGYSVNGVTPSYSNELCDNNRSIDVETTNVKTSLKVWKSGGGVYYQMLYVTYKGGYGNVKITQKIDRPIRHDNGVDDWGTQYTLDYKETYVSVGELNVMPYPYTWDFTSEHYHANNNQNITINNMWNSRNLTAEVDAVPNDGIAYNNNRQYGAYGAWDYVSGSGNQLKTYAPNAELWYSEGVDYRNSDNLTPYLLLNTPEPKSRFASNSQLAYATKPWDGVIIKDGGTVDHITPIRETLGLGVGLNKISQSADVVNLGDENGGFVLSTSSSDDLRLTIPMVPDNMFVFVKTRGDEAPQLQTQRYFNYSLEEVSGDVQQLQCISNNNVVHSITDDFNGRNDVVNFTGDDVPAKVYVYKVSLPYGVSTADVVLLSKNIVIDAIGVTDEFKLFTNAKGWVTDSRRRRIDYRNTGLFTNHNVKSYQGYNVTEFDSNYNGFLATVESPVIMPKVENYSYDDSKKKGVILHDLNVNGQKILPLFVPACNFNDNDLSSNWLKDHIDRGSLGQWSDAEVRYVFTNKYYNKEEVGGQRDYKVAEEYDFYVLTTLSNARGNIAFLDVPKSYSPNVSVGRAKKFYISYVDNDDDNDDIFEDSIEEIEDDIIDMKSSKLDIYTLNGAKLQTVPTEKGIYIINGKKVVIK